MKKIIIPLLVICLPHLFLKGQIVVNSQDMPITGNTYTKSIAATTGNIDYKQTGSNYIWDFSSLVPINQTVDTFVSVMQTPIFYYPTFITSANQALKQPNINLVVLQMTNVYNFLNNNTNAYNLIGYAAQISGIPVPLKYDNPDRIFKFPLNYGNVDSSSSQASLNLTGYGYFKETKKRKNFVDGYGTLVTPYGSFQVVRVKSIIYQKDSLHLDTIPVNLPAVERNITEYKWIAKNHGIPLLEITETSMGMLPAITTTISYKDSTRNLAVIEKPSTTNDWFKVYPNPAKDNFFIDFKLVTSSNIKIEIFDITGNKIKEISQYYEGRGNYKIELDLISNKINRGIYFIKFINGKNTNFSKLVVL